MGIFTVRVADFSTFRKYHSASTALVSEGLATTRFFQAEKHLHHINSGAVRVEVQCYQEAGRFMHNRVE